MLKLYQINYRQRSFGSTTKFKPMHAIRFFNKSRNEWEYMWRLLAVAHDKKEAEEEFWKYKLGRSLELRLRYEIMSIELVDNSVQEGKTT